MKVLLINTPQSAPEKWRFPITIFMPMGLAYIAAVLERAGIEVRILDALAEGWRNTYRRDGFEHTGLSPEDILARIRDYAPSVVGITSPFTTQARNVMAVAALAKQYDPTVTVVVGGPHPSIQPQQTLECPSIDYVVVGEGEYAFRDFVRQQTVNGDVSQIPGLAFRRGTDVVVNPPEAIKDLDALPFPAYHLLPMNEYYEAARRVRASRSISTYRKRWATLITSRGCPYQCIFCSIKPTMGSRWRARSPENVLSEIEFLIRTYRIRHFDIEDDNVSLDRKRFGRILDLIIERKLNIEWSTPNGMMAQTLDEELIRRMKQAGCTRAVFAPESGDQEVVRNVIRKNIDLSKVADAVRWARQYRLKSECFFVLGCPGETLESMRKTIAFARHMRRLGTDDCGFFLATPFHGTELRRLAEEKGFLRELFGDDGLNTLSGEPMIETSDFTADQLKTIWREARKVNPPISFGRIKLALAMLIGDPVRFARFAMANLVPWTIK